MMSLMYKNQYVRIALYLSQWLFYMLATQLNVSKHCPVFLLYNFYLISVVNCILETMKGFTEKYRPQKQITIEIHLILFICMWNKLINPPPFSSLCWIYKTCKIIVCMYIYFQISETSKFKFLHPLIAVFRLPFVVLLMRVQLAEWSLVDIA